MSCLAEHADIPLARRARDRSAELRAAVFWGFILLVIVSPAVISAWMILQQG
jgi:hypothetical protein